jgi:Asp-tRNA(Asn)/Glu-tRNA(Gln) amidotransferase A subunit family amidase
MKECLGNIKERGKAVNAYISVEDKDYLLQQASEAQSRWHKGMQNTAFVSIVAKIFLKHRLMH